MRTLFGSRSKFLLLLSLLSLQILGFATTYKAWIDVSLNQNEMVEFKISTSGNSKPAISNFDVIEAVGDKWNYTNPLWSIASSPGNFLDIGRIVYGTNIPGFTSTKAATLRPAKHYMAMLNGAGIVADVEFVVEIVDGKMQVRSLGTALGHPRK